MTRELRERIDLAIEALPPAQRTVVLLRDIAGKSTPECVTISSSPRPMSVYCCTARAKIRRIARMEVRGDNGPPRDITPADLLSHSDKQVKRLFLDAVFA
jgi:hypothetical protein